MKFEAHKYQKRAIDFIKAHGVSCLILDMGLGKTVTTLTAINDLLFDEFKIHKVLVIAPLRVARKTWSDEIKKWEHLQELKYEIVVGTEKERMMALNRKADIYIINRENVSWLVSKCKFDFDTLVVDELSSFKNRTAKRLKDLLKVRPFVKRVIGLTGTPAPNGLMDLWAEFRLLDMGERLGKFITRYRDEYFKPDKTNGQVVYSYKPLDGAKEKIYEKIKDITISMESSDYLEMPKLVVNNYEVELEKEERLLYMRMKKDYVISVNEKDITSANAVGVSNKLRQMASGFIYDENEKAINIHNKKLDALEDIIESANGKPIMIAYWFKEDLVKVKERIKDAKEIKTNDDIDKWNKGEIPIALIHPQSSGHGLNLQDGGNQIVWFTLPWSLELYEQTNARLYRQGQKENIVIVTHIITKGTIDEKVVKALKEKNLTQDNLIKAVKEVI